MSDTPKKQDHGSILKIAIPSPLRRLFDYSLPNNPNQLELEQLIGARVLVEFGRREVVGVVLDIANETTVSKDKLKPVLRLLDDKGLFPTPLLDTLRWASAYYQYPVGEVFAAALPRRFRRDTDIYGCATFYEPSAKARTEIAEERLSVSPRAHRQRELIAALTKKGYMTPEDVSALGFSSQVLKQLIAGGHVEKSERRESPQPEFDYPDPLQGLALNAEQKTAVDAVNAGKSSFACYLLDGVTGSGKTEVYMQAMHSYLHRGEQVLVLVPEIGLTPQAIARFTTRFSCEIAIIHSGLSEGQRAYAWRRAREGSVGIVLGTRSAVFTPLASLGLIIVDEEHDSSYKQQDGFKYSAKNFAVIRAKNEAIPIVLGSATPSLESFANVRNGRYRHLRLQSRAGGASPPSLRLLDTSQQELQGGFCEESLEAIRQTIEQGNQALVYINRRGFAPVLSCDSCGWVAECERCDAQYTLHKFPPSLRCHHCGVQRRIPTKCPSCQGSRLTALGTGTQKSEQFLVERFPATAVLRIDRDSTRSAASLDDALAQVAGGEPCILVGTQMLAKGHHFPKLTLVVILDADTGLFSADFRGQEIMSQTLLQVAGRAGRGELPGRVLLQSRNSGHETLQNIASLDYSRLCEQLLADRQASAMPPYSHMALIRAEAKDQQVALLFLTRLGKLITQQPAVSARKVLMHGPLPAPMERRAGRFRMQLHIRSESRGVLQQLLSLLCDEISSSAALKQLSRRVRWAIDVDPVDLL